MSSPYLSTVLLLRGIYAVTGMSHPNKAEIYCPSLEGHLRPSWMGGMNTGIGCSGKKSILIAAA